MLHLGYQDHFEKRITHQVGIKALWDTMTGKDSVDAAALNVDGPKLERWLFGNLDSIRSSSSIGPNPRLKRSMVDQFRKFAVSNMVLYELAHRRAYQ